ncbi:hypothetical protein [Streptomyces physcomitrii]|uniref:Secreted protein n=1 Tax=Streptomyces physcomitrii TaxID=2724184 RepID=A0ABX1H1R2_9ACTN|nr:hypothetical protein [Streptomyces physcomitrii]NKI41230.1 hypothetical protein [Streptomyces physcomitrii]
MNDTVAVALITSLSTLAAAGLAALVAARSTARQLRYQAALAREERAEQRESGRREVCAAACERFLAQADAAYRVLDEGWAARPFREPLPWQDGFAARRALDEAYVRVQLTAPEAVVRAGRAVVQGIAAEFRTHGRIVGEAVGGGGGVGAGAEGEGDRGVSALSFSEPSASGLSASESDPAARSRALRERFAGTERFVAAVRVALGVGEEAAPVTGSVVGEGAGEPGV